MREFSKIYLNDLYAQKTGLQMNLEFLKTTIRACRGGVLRDQFLTEDSTTAIHGAIRDFIYKPRTNKVTYTYRI